MSFRLFAAFSVCVLLASQAIAQDMTFDAKLLAHQLVQSERAAEEYDFASLKFSAQGEQKLVKLREETLKVSGEMRAKMPPEIRKRHDGCPLASQNAILVSISSVNSSKSAEVWLVDRSSAYQEYRYFQKHYALIQNGEWGDIEGHDSVNKYMKRYRERAGINRKIFKSAALDQFVRDAISQDSGRLSESSMKIFRGMVNYDICFTDTGNRLVAESVLKNSANSSSPIIDEDVDEALWLIAQHADSDLEFQKMMLLKLEVQARHGDSYLSRYAYLYDRVAINSGGQQRYGTQMQCNESGTWTPLPTENPEKLDERRASMHMEPEREYAKRGQFYCNN